MVLAMQLIIAIAFNCWPNDTTEPFLCDKFSHILVAALPLPNDVASDGFI
jgi:hypothetical protein